MIKEIENRRSIRKYLEKDIPIDLINEMLASASLAPSAKNRQPWKYIVLKNKAKAEMLDKMDQGIKREEKSHDVLPQSEKGLPDAKNTLRIMRQAPCIILVINTNGSSTLKPLENMDERVKEQCDLLSIGASIENMLLTATELGIGTLWIANTCFAYPELEEWLKESHQIEGAIAVGYAAEEPAKRPRKELSKIVEYRLV